MREIFSFKQFYLVSFFDQNWQRIMIEMPNGHWIQQVLVWLKYYRFLWTAQMLLVTKRVWLLCRYLVPESSVCRLLKKLALKFYEKKIGWGKVSHTFKKVIISLRYSWSCWLSGWPRILYMCLVLLQVPKCFGLVQIFCARPKIYLHIVAITNILCQTKIWFAFSKIVFCVGTKVFEEALNAVKFLGWLKKFGPAQNILGPVKGQGKSFD